MYCYSSSGTRSSLQNKFECDCMYNSDCTALNTFGMSCQSGSCGCLTNNDCYGYSTGSKCLETTSQCGCNSD